MSSKTFKISGFPSPVTATQVTTFLERYTFAGSIIALKLRQSRNSRAFAIVQFSKNEDAKDLILMIQRRKLYYNGSYLTLRNVERDIIPKPREPMFVLENVKLYLGCPLSPERLSVLWSVEDVDVKFGFEMRKIDFCLSYGSCSYKLELAYDSIWEIQLHRSFPQRSQFLVFQVVAAPKIYKISSQNGQSIYGDPIYNYFKDAPDDQWVRTVDFSPSSSIGQSCALCLELPYKYNLPDIHKYFFHYKEVDSLYAAENGFSYSRNLGLVPIVEPPSGIEVSYEILYKINYMVQNGILIGQTLDRKFYNLVRPCPSRPSAYIERALEMMSVLENSCFAPAKWLIEQYAKFSRSKHLNSPTISLDSDSGLVYVHRVQVTPSKVFFNRPKLNVSNRVLRHYDEVVDDFLRISFVDEDLVKMHSNHILARPVSVGSERHTALYWRILSILKDGITIGNKKFEFLAFSSSQLRENSAWMFASSNNLSAASIREWMGDFRNIRNVAKYAARLGQSFSSSTETLSVEIHEVHLVPDIKQLHYVFSDGIGKISAEFAKKVAAKCRFKGFSPSAFQIRYAGYKGVVAVDPTSSAKLSLRKSMSKFESKNTKLDVLAYSKYQPCFLNRQLITLLSTLGIIDCIFEKKLEEAVYDLDAILTDPVRALEAVQLMHPGETANMLKELLLCGYKPDAEPFVSMLLQAFRASRLLQLRTKARIFVPKGRAMIGCLDESGSLKYGQVFVQVSCLGNSKFHNNQREHPAVVLEGKIIVAKNPCLHPGDVRILEAVDVPHLHHMVDCVVFPQKGKRPHPNECSGSDLDGDVYFVSWDPELIPARMAKPMEYAPAPKMELDHDVTIEEVMVYFTNYIVNDSLGIIANAHTVFADKSKLKAECHECLKLAKLFSIAVDFPKTGVPAEIPPDLQVKEYPDFMEKQDKVTYESKGIIGKLYRAIKDHKPDSVQIKTFTKQVAARSYDADMEVDGYENHLDDAFFFKEEYDFKLGNLMDHYGIKTEVEIISGNIMKMSKIFTKNRDAEAIGKAVRALRKEARSWFKDKQSDHEHDEDEENAKASAWYYVTYHPSYWGRYNDGLKRPHFLSFPWCVYDKLTQIKQKKISKRKAASQVSLLQNRMRGLLIGGRR
ncbi:LOW QUALITY PROTEIN: putative RNA-dependent RNA polymerase 1 [Curcuma longa]|uniref:LOW QUALITY PROTEIN: putative RNA-dependent RNA polymerase 1 n=1 Tax=Curcuma longa TaxID=136217 RepID=UPI003D9F5D6E